MSRRRTDAVARLLLLALASVGMVFSTAESAAMQDGDGEHDHGVRDAIRKIRTSVVDVDDAQSGVPAEVLSTAVEAFRAVPESSHADLHDSLRRGTAFRRDGIGVQLSRAVALYFALPNDLASRASVASTIASLDGDRAVAGVRVLRGRAFDEGLEPALRRLSEDDRAEIRYEAMRWATQALQFGSESPLARRVCVAAFADRDSRVAFNFARELLISTQDETVLAAAMKRASDDRSVERTEHGPLACGAATVGPMVTGTLAYLFASDYSAIGNPRWEDEHAEPDALKRWWGSVRREWSFEPRSTLWDTVCDSVIKFPRAGGTVSVGTRGGDVLRVTMSEFSERLHEGQPVRSFRLAAAVGVDSETVFRLRSNHDPDAFLNEVGVGDPSEPGSIIARIASRTQGAEEVVLRLRVFRRK